jgi:hypothetical protein
MLAASDGAVLLGAGAGVTTTGFGTGVADRVGEGVGDVARMVGAGVEGAGAGEDEPHPNSRVIGIEASGARLIKDSPIVNSGLTPLYRPPSAILRLTVVFS